MLRLLLSRTSVASNLLRNAPINPTHPAIPSPPPFVRPHFTKASRSHSFANTASAPRCLGLNSAALLKIPRGGCVNGSPFSSLLLMFSYSRPGFSVHRVLGYQPRWRSCLPGGATHEHVVWGLIVTNLAVFMLWRVADPFFLTKNFMISLDNVMSGRVHTLITSAFSHVEAGHIFLNMIGLYLFGMSLGREFGPEFLLKLYLVGAVCGSVFYLAHQAWLAASSKQGNKFSFVDPSRTAGLGASGAVNAIMLLDLFLFPKNTVYINFIFPVPAILVGIYIIGNDMWKIIEGDAQVSGSAHLGGATVAAIAWARIRKGYFKF